VAFVILQSIWLTEATKRNSVTNDDGDMG
jgi:hypothetical protein